jgi:hypothetical protein
VTKNRYGKRWARWNEKLERYDIRIDLADIRTLSRRMYETGKVSRKVLKKWDARGRKNIYGNKNRYSFDGHDCHWMPYKPKSKWSVGVHWKCSRCQCSTAWIYFEDAPESFRQDPFLQHIRHREGAP